MRPNRNTRAYKTIETKLGADSPGHTRKRSALHFYLCGKRRELLGTLDRVTSVRFKCERQPMCNVNIVKKHRCLGVSAPRDKV
ncbi:hypothetical protein B5X24_HaOG204244 [Helicoverpa armigera]|nr:hypothetical protein B5X24_HaOG204244 [Helicoverpa armigera]